VLQSPRILIATGSRPRHVAAIEVDHEHVVDSDSILSVPYLPRNPDRARKRRDRLRVRVDFCGPWVARSSCSTRRPSRLGFLDPSLRAGFLEAFRSMGGSYRGGAEVEGSAFSTAFHRSDVLLKGGDVLRSDIVFAAFGPRREFGRHRSWIGSGSASTAAGHVQVNERFETNIPGHLCGGPMAIGPPALACAAADQGRRRGARRVRSAAALDHQSGPDRRVHDSRDRVRRPVANRGGCEEDRRDRRACRLRRSGRARAHCRPHGGVSSLYICERGTGRVLGVQVIGDGATDLVHLGQAAIATAATAEFFVEQIFNFPTMTEAYRDRRIRRD